MAVKIAIANQKGGVGKTTTALNLADALRHLGFRVLLVDMDPQHNASNTYGAKIKDENTIVDLLKKDCTAKEAIQTTPMGDIIAGDEVLVNEEPFFNAKKAREHILKSCLKEIDGDYDYIIMDTPPNLGIYMVNSLTAADGCVIPVKAEQYSIDGLGLLMGTVREVVELLNEDLKIYGVLLTLYDVRNNLDVSINEYLPEVGEQAGFDTFKHPIHVSQDVKKVQAIPDTVDANGNTVVPNRSLFDNYTMSTAAADYVDFTKEVLAKLGVLKNDELVGLGVKANG